MRDIIHPGVAAVFSLAVLSGAMPVRGVGTSILAVSCQFDAPQLVSDTTGYACVSVEGCVAHARPGWPRLPFRIVRLLLPPGAGVAGVNAFPEVAPQVLAGRWRVEYERHPQPLGATGAMRATVADLADAAAYGAAGSIPVARAELATVQRLAGYDIAFVRVYPLVYTPAEGRLDFTPVLRIELTLTNQTDRTPRLVSRDGLSARQHARDRVTALVDNAAALKLYEPPQAMAASAATTPSGTSSSYDYLLVSGQSLLPAFQPLVDRRNADGLRVCTESMENIVSSSPGRDAAEKLRNFIRYAYTNWGVEYVLLGGDVATVPCRYAYGYCGGSSDQLPCDLYFACLDGTWNRDNDSFWGEPTDGNSGGDVDLLAEVFIGRAPVDTPEEAARFVSKTIAYETAGAVQPFQVVCAGEYLGTASAQGGAALDRILPVLSNGSFRVQWLDDRTSQEPAWTTADLLAVLNRAPHLVFHQGHADDTTVMRLTVADLDALTNPTPFFCYSTGCDAGAFDNPSWIPDCIGEELVKRNAGGAFAAIFNSRLGWFTAQQPWKYSGEFQQAFLDQLCSRGNTTLGQAHQLAKQALVGLVETSGDMPYRWCYFDLNLLGDPYTPIVTPIVMGINVPSVTGHNTCTLQWNSLSNRLYSVLRTTNATLTGFTCLKSNLVATIPMNTYTDAVPGVTHAFYKITADRR